MANRRPASVILAVATIAAMAWCAVAAPFRPVRPALPDEALSLAGLVHLSVRPIVLPPDLTDVSVEAGDARDQLRSALAKAGFEMVDEEKGGDTGKAAVESEVPELALTILTSTDPKQPDGIAVTVIFSVYQRVHLRRLDRSMTVPTATMGHTRLTTRTSLADAFAQELRRTVQTLQAYVRAARP